MASGGFRTSLVSEDLGSPEVEFIASEHYTLKPGGVTLDASTVGADADGNKILTKGTVLALVASSGLYRAYLNSEAADAGGTADCLLWESVNLKDGNVLAGALIHGTVRSARTSGIDASGRVDLAGRVIFLD